MGLSKIIYKENLINTIKEVVNAGVVNAIHCTLPILALIQRPLTEAFPNTTFRYSDMQDITDKTEQREIATSEHNTAHRAAQENVKQILRDYFFPKMLRLTTETAFNCKIRSMTKYSRHPNKHKIGQTPIPYNAG